MAGAHISEAAALMMMLLRAIRSSWLENGAVIESSCQSEVAATLLRLPSKRPHPTLVETTLPQRGRLVRAPGLLLMCSSCSMEPPITIKRSTFMTEEIRFCLKAEEAPSLPGAYPMRWLISADAFKASSTLLSRKVSALRSRLGIPVFRGIPYAVTRRAAWANVSNN